MSDKYSGEIDPEIAELLSSSGGMPLSHPPVSPEPDNSPSFDDLFAAPKKQPVKAPVTESTVDFSKKTFTMIRDFFEAPKPVFTNKDYYKGILQNGGEEATRLHKVLSDYLNSQDPETRGQSRLRIIPAWWDFLEHLVRGVGPQMPLNKLYALRFGALLPSLVSPEQRTTLASVIIENKTGEPIHYIDEWLRKVGNGEVAPLATDEEIRPVKKGGDNSLLRQKLEKLQGQNQAQTNLIRIKLHEIDTLEASLANLSVQVRDHDKNSNFPDMKDIYNTTQRSAMSGIQDALRQLVNMDKELAIAFRDLEKIRTELTNTEGKLSDSGVSTVDAKVVLRELSSIRQMCKLSCGRQGNQFPLLMKQYMPQRQEDVGTRENVLTIMAEIERLDPGLFLRTFKSSVNRIVPHVILLPCFGDTGLCWEPFEKFNRSTSRGRIGIPMYPKDLRMAVIFTLGDLRWQVAKEKAGYRWMEEGLTGWYYQWFSERGLRGDVREYFIQDYILWLTKESEGTQKLDKDVRGIFWRNIPFPQDIRDMLKNRGFAYNDLYKKDINRSLSDGY